MSCGAQPEATRLRDDQAQIGKALLRLVGCAARGELATADHHLHHLSPAVSPFPNCRAQLLVPLGLTAEENGSDHRGE
jgi:hypothetical protein